MPRIVLHAADAPSRHRLETWLSREPGFELVGIAADLPALRALVGRNPDTVILAVAPDADFWSWWRSAARSAALVAIQSEGTPEDGLELLHAGARAILPSGADSGVVIAAIKAAGAGLAVLPGPLLAALLEAEPEGADPAFLEGAADHAGLTERERDVLAAMAAGASNKAIARRLGISVHTVKFHVAAILAKLDADSRTEAVAKAAHRGLVML
ncbi:MAG: response regulator transcription factor [Proteobacteria bacterium]|nr:response regulator transcription factor [Pseudomonadota bacterium]MBI3498697.1 response regulator transcription factor [Pseudomonadota bacterium]